jgi:tetratricopeptide (TPR) repeat protein
MWKKGASGFDPVGRYNAALALQRQGSLLQAEQELAKLHGVELSADLSAKVAELEQAIDDAHAERELRFHNEEGTEFMDTQLKRFERERLQGEPSREVVRVFLKRCREFRERWPRHPELDWVDRYEARFRGYVDLSAPPSYKDIAFEIETLTWAKPRDYEKAFAILDAFVDAGPTDERGLALELKDKLEQERVEYFEDRMLQAKYHWEKDEHGQAVEWLAQVIMKIGDAEMAAEAAREMLLLPGIEEWLRGYKSNRSDKWERLVREPSIREYAAEHGI